MNMREDLSIVFFGSSYFSLLILEALEEANFLPKLIVTTKDMPKGRGMILARTPVKEWAIENKYPFIEVSNYDQETASILKDCRPDIFIVASYGKIIPENCISIPKRGALNVHPSLLPKFRGATPIPSQILADDKDVGVSIMLIDEKVDHGPILAQESLPITPWPTRASFLIETLGEFGGKLLVETIPGWIAGDIKTKEQDHQGATFTHKFEKSEGSLDLKDDSYQNYLKFCAFENSIGTYFFAEKKGPSHSASLQAEADKKIRVKITNADFKDRIFTPLNVIPEGGKEMTYKDFLLGFKL